MYRATSKTLVTRAKTIATRLLRLKKAGRPSMEQRLSNTYENAMLTQREILVAPNDSNKLSKLSEAKPFLLARSLIL